jgi:ABC-type dipeptide/oligopeptide/nickel transport system ATPase subunit
MYKIKVNNCNNVTSAEINLNEGMLNVKYAMNGTGKSTIGKMIELLSTKKPLSSLKTFGSEIEPNGEIPTTISKVLLFNEDFVNSIVFTQNEVIQNAFDVFIKSDEYDDKQRKIDEKLKEIHIDTSANKDLNTLMSIGLTVLSKFSLTTKGELKQTGLIKNLTSAESIFQLPDTIKKYGASGN